MGNTQYTIQYYAQNGALSYYHVWANSEGEAISEFNNWVREQKRGLSNYDSKFGEIYRIES